MKEVTIELRLPETYFDPRTKLYVTLFVLIVIFYSEKYIMIGTITAFSCLLLFYKNRGKMITIIKSTAFLTLFAVLSTMFAYYMLKQYDFLKTFIIIEGRFLTSFWIISWFFLSVSAYEMTLMLEKMFVPVTLTWMMTTAYQFIPIFFLEASTVNEIRKIRGVRIKRKNPLEMMEGIRLILNPLIASSVNRGIELAEAMIIKGYKPKRRRIRLYNLKLKIRDGILITILTTIGVLGLIYSPI